MRYLLFLIELLLIAGSAPAQYSGPIKPISEGFGADGPENIAVKNIANDHYLQKDISIFYPKGVSNPVPTIYFSHGYGGVDTAYYRETLHHLASRGYAVVYVPYKSSLLVSNDERYATLYDGFTKATRTLGSVIDSTRVGFYGHSFGGGATPAVAFKAFSLNNWGTNGRFIYCDAPWYTYQLTNSDLENFPADCNMLAVVYEEDTVNDHRMAMDIFNNIAIPTENKDFIIAHSDTVDNYVYQANHSVPVQYTPRAEFNALDYYIKFRLLDALAEYTFTGNTNAKNIALGNGSQEQIHLHDSLSKLFVTNQPNPEYPESRYVNPCNSDKNPRREFCLPISAIPPPAIQSNITLYPNPAKENIYINRSKDLSSIVKIKIFNQFGHKVMERSNQEKISIKSLKSGCYIIELQTEDHILKKKIIKTKK